LSEILQFVAPVTIYKFGNTQSAFVCVYLLGHRIQ